MEQPTAIVVQPQKFYLAPVADVEEAVLRYKAVKDFVAKILIDKIDYGKVPGSDKPSLLKPGAEKMTSFFGLSPRFILEEKVEDWTGDEHNGEPFFYYRYKCQLFKGDYIVAEGEGSCNSWEKKYRYRQGVKLCPTCGQPTIFKSKNKPEYFCWAKKGGCGATFKLDDRRITEQESGQIKNPDPAEQVNTLQKMAQKRSLIAPVLLATNTSEMFTQDIEDFQSTSEPVFDGEFEDVKPIQTTRPEQPAPASNGHNPVLPFTLSECEDMQTSDGKRYGDLSTTDILNRLNAMSKAKNPDDARMLKIEMTKHLLAARNRGESPEPAGLVETAEQLGGQQN